MRLNLSRRGFSQLLTTGLVAPQVWALEPAKPLPLRIRTITASVVFGSRFNLRRLEDSLAFLSRARQVFVDSGYEVQTLRIATQPLATYLPQWNSSDAMALIREMDAVAADAGAMLSIGPVLTDDQFPDAFPNWAAELISATTQTSFTASIASRDAGVHAAAVQAAAATIARIARTSPGGEGNFRFAATAFCPAGTPFFPAAWYDQQQTFSLGLESPALLSGATGTKTRGEDVRSILSERLNRALAPVETIAGEVAHSLGWDYLGIDTSPAPGLDASIGEVIEQITGQPFGSSSTLSACALLTDVLKGLKVKSCGYSGLMLPVLEDRVLARRAAEGRYGINELLLYSSVCGTGLDVVPLPGDTPVDALAAVIGDVAALANKYQKPLSARLFPIPGKKVGDRVSFENPHLTDSVVMQV